MNIVLSGPSGTGKGTLTEMLSLILDAELEKLSKNW
mgnify:CR=1 FL=1